MSSKQYVLWGGTGQSIVLEELLQNDFELLAVFDNNKSLQTPFESIPIYFGWNNFVNWLETRGADNLHFAVAIGGSHGADRLDIHDQILSQGLLPINAVHRTAFVANNATMGLGCQIMAQASICARASLGTSVMVNTMSAVDHECILESGVHVGPGARLAGNVHVKRNTFIGAGTTVLPNISIGANSIIGAGSVVTRDVQNNVIAYGNPCKVVRPNLS